MQGLRPKVRLAVALGALAAICCVGVAAATVTVYTNDFSKKGEFKELRKTGGKHCDSNYRGKKEVARLKVSHAPEVCGFEPPVAGDNPQPDHIFQAQGKLAKSTKKQARKKAFLFVEARVGGKAFYELRIFPKTHKFKLKRVPSGGAFPMGGTDNKVHGVGDKNKLRLRVIGNDIKGIVNGKTVASVTDANANQVKGKKLEFGAGNTSKTNKPTEAIFNSVRLGVPNA